MSQSVEAPVDPRSASPARPPQTWLLVGTVALIGTVSVVFAFRAGRAQCGSCSVPQAVEQLKDSDFDTRQAAARSLLAMGADAGPYAAEIETAVKDAAWEFATTVLPELGTYADSTFQVVGSTIKQPSAEELQRQEARRRENERKQKEQLAKAEKWKDYILTLLKALEAADPERMKAIKGKVVVDLLSERPSATNTFHSVGNTISSTP